MSEAITATEGDLRLKRRQFMTDDERIAELLQAWVERYDNGHDVSADDLCRDDPHLAERVAGLIGELKACHWLNQSAAGGHVVETQKQTSEFQSGTVLAERYRLEEQIGEGGSGE